MKIVEALKRLRVIEKRLTSHRESVTRYSSMVSTEKPLFETEDRQRKEVISLIQSSKDLIEEYLKIGKQIKKSNLQVIVEMGGRDYTISDLLVIKDKLAGLMVKAFSALNDSAGESRLRHSTSVEGKTPHVVRFYREEMRNEGLRVWQDLYDNISSRLEVVNATTDLIE